MTFCAAPFVHIVHNPDGQYRTCCMYKTPLKGSHKNIKEAFNSEENQIIRKRMLSGERLHECEKCDIDEMHGGKNKVSYSQLELYRDELQLHQGDVTALRGKVTELNKQYNIDIETYKTV